MPEGKEKNVQALNDENLDVSGGSKLGDWANKHKGALIGLGTTAAAAAAGVGAYYADQKFNEGKITGKVKEGVSGLFGRGKNSDDEENGVELESMGTNG